MGIAAPCWGNYTFDYNERCSLAYRQFMSLRPDEGRKTLMSELAANPNNLMLVYLLDYEDCLLLLFNGSREEYDKRKEHAGQRITILDKGDKQSPWYRLCKAGVYMHWSIIYGRFGDNIKAATAYRKSFILLKENRSRFPAFRYNDVMYGVEEAIAGTIPEGYAWLASMLGVKGDVSRGVRRIGSFVAAHKPEDMFYAEALMYYDYLRFYLLSEKEEAWQAISSRSEDNLLFLFLKANMALNFRKSEAALATLKQAEKLQGYEDFPMLDYEMACALLFRQDPACIRYYQRFIERYRGSFFLKDAYMRMAFFYYLRNEQALADRYRKKILDKGNTIADSDKQAVRFAKKNAWPNKVLLQVRLLSDGGSHAAATKLLAQYDAKDFATPAHVTEYYYRKARLLHEADKHKEAVYYYNEAIKAGRELPEQYAARAALQMGLLYEDQRKPNEAIYWFKESMKMENEEFKNSIDQQAKSGINRLTK